MGLVHSNGPNWNSNGLENKFSCMDQPRNPIKENTFRVYTMDLQNERRAGVEGIVPAGRWAPCGRCAWAFGIKRNIRNQTFRQPVCIEAGQNETINQLIDLLDVCETMLSWIICLTFDSAAPTTAFAVLAKPETVCWPSFANLLMNCTSSYVYSTRCWLCIEIWLSSPKRVCTASDRAADSGTSIFVKGLLIEVPFFHIIHFKIAFQMQNPRQDSKA